MDKVQDQLSEIAKLSISETYLRLNSSEFGLTNKEAIARIQEFGSNTFATHKASALKVLLRQLNNPILWLLAGALFISSLLGDLTNAGIILFILALSIGLGFLTEFRAEKASEDLHSRVTHHATVKRDNETKSILISDLVPGDFVSLRVGSIVPADIRLIEVENFECDESLISGESLPVEKNAEFNSENLRGNLAFMGTVVRSGAANGLVVRTGGNSEFGRIAITLAKRQPLTNFQIGLGKFSYFLLRLAILIALMVIVGNIVLKRSIIESVLYALALAVGMTPQLLPAIVSTALALGSRALAKEGVLIKRLISIEDLGDLDILITDKTGTLTTGVISFEEAISVGNRDLIQMALLATDGKYEDILKSLAGLTALDEALWSANSKLFPASALKISAIPFDHNRRMSSALVLLSGEKLLVAKGSPEDIFKNCKDVPESAKSLLATLYEKGSRTIAVAWKNMEGKSTLEFSDEKELQLAGFLTFSDPLKENVKASLDLLKQLNVEIKVATGDSLEVSKAICSKVGIPIDKTLMGTQVDLLSDSELAKIALETSIFARVSPDQKARIIKALRSSGESIGFLGDGVNDAIALHDSDVGISVDSATDVARDAADVVLLEKDLGVLANGIRKGREVFNNTMKYILMATSADFGNLISASIGSLVLPFLPMLPTQVLLQDLLYDSSQLSIPGDNVDIEQVTKPSHWNLALIKRFMLVFGLASSIFDFATFALLLWVFHAKQEEFHTGWFIESLATATLVVFVIRTRRTPFFKSRPSLGLITSIFGVVTLSILLTISPLAKELGFTTLPIGFYLILFAIVAIYLSLVEYAKRKLFK